MSKISIVYTAKSSRGKPPTVWMGGTYPSKEAAQKFISSRAWRTSSPHIVEYSTQQELSDWMAVQRGQPTSRSRAYRAAEKADLERERARREPSAAARGVVRTREDPRALKQKNLADINRKIRQAKTAEERQRLMQQRSVISAKTPGQIYKEKQEKERREKAPGGLLVTPVSETTKEKIKREEAGLSRRELVSRRAASTFRMLGYDVDLAGGLMTAQKPGIERKTVVDVSAAYPIIYKVPKTAKVSRGFESYLSPRRYEPPTKDILLADLFRRQKRKVSVSDSGIVSVMPTLGIADKYERVIVTRPTGFESQLGTGQPKFYATGLLGKAYVFGKEIKTKAKKGVEKIREYKPTTELFGRRFISEKGLLEDVKGGAKFGAAPILLPFEYSSKVFKKEVSPSLIKFEAKRFESADYFFTKASEPSKESKLLQTPQQQGKPYKTHKFMDFSFNIPFHIIGEKAQKFKRFARKTSYIGAGIGSQTLGTTAGIVRFVGEKPLSATAMFYGGKYAAKFISHFGVGTAFVGYSGLTAPSGQKLRTMVSTAGAFGLLGLTAKGVGAVKETPGRIQSVLARRREIPGIISDAARPFPKPYKTKPGLEGFPKVSEAVVRKKALPGMEFVEGKAITGKTKPGMYFAKEPAPGAAFKGIARVTPKEPTTITKKDSMLFKELGIEEGGILKAARGKRKLPRIFPRSLEILNIGSMMQPKISYEKVVPVRKIGTIKTIKGVTVRKEGPLKFEYERRRLTEKKIGFGAPMVTTVFQPFQKGLKTYDVSTIIVGRNIFGSMQQRSFLDPFFSTRKTTVFLFFLISLSA